ncbi:hypothetical protein T439DRAFT_329168 [Meredithblackwellia eburnea MCA 4105]
MASVLPYECWLNIFNQLASDSSSTTALYLSRCCLLNSLLREAAYSVLYHHIVLPSQRDKVELLLRTLREREGLRSKIRALKVRRAGRRKEQWIELVHICTNLVDLDLEKAAEAGVPQHYIKLLLSTKVHERLRSLSLSNTFAHNADGTYSARCFQDTFLDLSPFVSLQHLMLGDMYIDPNFNADLRKHPSFSLTSLHLHRATLPSHLTSSLLFPILGNSTPNGTLTELTLTRMTPVNLVSDDMSWAANIVRLTIGECTFSDDFNIFIRRLNNLKELFVNSVTARDFIQCLHQPPPSLRRASFEMGPFWTADEVSEGLLPFFQDDNTTWEVSVGRVVEIWRH